MVRQTMVQLTDALIARADREAARRQMSRSALIRAALETYLAKSREVELDERMRAGYEATPQATADRWGDPIALTTRTTRDVLRRLDAEEAAAGDREW